MAVTPIRRQMSVVPATRAPAPAPMSAPAPGQQGWVWDGSSWQWVDDPDCCNPPQGWCPPPWWNCPPSWWNCCPPCPPPSPFPPPPLAGPIVGVTDGSDAAPGQVGEYVTAQASRTYPASPSNTTSSVSVMVIQPGDWDIYAMLQATNYIDGLVFTPATPIVGLGPTLQGSMVSAADTAAAISEYPIVTGMARGNFAVPTLMAMNVQVVMQTAGLVAGTAYLTMWARRMR